MHSPLTGTSGSRHFSPPSPTRPSIDRQPASIRALPRCAVVNFQKDGENLSWKPRVSQNLSGLPARAHNFEDAFSLEEFSSTTLPVVWTATGGNPRLSITDNPDDHLDPRERAYDPECHKNSAVPSPTGVPELNVRSLSSLPTHVPEDDGHAKYNRVRAVTPNQPSLSARKRSFTRQHSFPTSAGIARTMNLAKDLRRPSFWSMLTQPRSYQQSRVRARIQTSEDVNRRREHASFPVFRRNRGSIKQETDSSASELSEKEKRVSRSSLIRRLGGKLGRRGGAWHAPLKVENDTWKCGDKNFTNNRMDSSDRGGNLSQKEIKDRAVRMRSLWSNGETGTRMIQLFAGRRVKSCLVNRAGVHESVDLVSDRMDHKCGKVGQDDQYVRFMTVG